MKWKAFFGILITGMLLFAIKSLFEGSEKERRNTKIAPGRRFESSRGKATRNLAGSKSASNQGNEKDISLSRLQPEKKRLPSSVNNTSELRPLRKPMDMLPSGKNMSFLQESRLIEEKEFPPDADGNRKWIGIFETSMKYPYVRVEEEIAKIESGGEGTVINRSAMVADHILVKPTEGISINYIREEIEAVGGRISRQLPYSGIVIIEFEPDIETYERVQKSLRNMEELKYADSDYITGIPEAL